MPRADRALPASASLLLAIMLSACALSAPVARLPTPSPTVLPSASPVPPTVTLGAPTAAPTPTISHTPTSAGLETAIATTPSTATEVGGSAQRPGSYDVYLSAPDAAGMQSLIWYEAGSGQIVTQVRIHTDDGQAVRAGQFIYYQAFGTSYPFRVNSAGVQEELVFARVPAGSSAYQLLPSGNGNWLAWISITPDGLHYEVGTAAWDGGGARVVASGDLAAGDTLRLLRLTNDGRTLFIIRQPAGTKSDGLFHARYELHGLDLASGQDTLLPGEPPCGEQTACDAHISPDGAYLARTLPPDSRRLSIVVTNLVSGALVAQFEPFDVPPGAALAVGYPYFTPGGEMVYTEAVGAESLRDFRLVWANLVTGEQKTVIRLGPMQLRPLGWTGDGYVLLATREPGFYDTWQIDLRDGSLKQIASLQFLGHIDVGGE